MIASDRAAAPASGSGDGLGKAVRIGHAADRQTDVVTAAIADLERPAWRGTDAAGRKRHDGVALVVDRDPEVETRTVGIDRDPGPVERADEGPATDEIGLLGIADGSLGGRVGEEAEQDSLEQPRGPGRPS